MNYIKISGHLFASVLVTVKIQTAVPPLIFDKQYVWTWAFSNNIYIQLETHIIVNYKFSHFLL